MEGNRRLFRVSVSRISLIIAPSGIFILLVFPTEEQKIQGTEASDFAENKTVLKDVECFGKFVESCVSLVEAAFLPKYLPSLGFDCSTFKKVKILCLFPIITDFYIVLVFFIAVARWFGSVGVCDCSIAGHSVYL